MKKFIVTENTIVVLNNQRYLLEAGDKLLIERDEYSDMYSDISEGWDKFMKTTAGQNLMAELDRQEDPAQSLTLRIRDVINMFKQWFNETYPKYINAWNEWTPSRFEQVFHGTCKSEIIQGNERRGRKPKLDPEKYKRLART